MASQAPLEIAFFDTETTIPSKKGEGFELLEFAAVVLAAEGLHEVFSYSTLFRPSDFGLITAKSVACNGITPEKCESAPRFEDTADEIFGILHGRIWAGHNIVNFDNRRIPEAFQRCNRPVPEPRGIIDTLPLLRSKFGTRAGNLKMSRLAEYCGLGEQEHRSLEDCRMNIEVLKHCATMLFLEANFSDIFSPSTLASAAPIQSSETNSPSSTLNRPPIDRGLGPRGPNRPPSPSVLDRGLGPWGPNGTPSPSVSDRGLDPRGPHRMPSPRSGLATSLEGEISAVSGGSPAAVSPAVFSARNEHNPPTETRSAPDDVLISSLAAMSLAGGTSSLVIHPPTNNHSQNPIEGPHIGNQAGLAEAVLPCTKITPQLSPDLRPGMAYAAGSSSPMTRSNSLPGGWDAQRIEPPETEAAPADGEKSPVPKARRAAQRGGPFGRWERPLEEERLRYIGEHESSEKVVSWLNQVSGVEVWAEPEGNEPDPSSSPAVGRPGRREFEAAQRKVDSRGSESRVDSEHRIAFQGGAMLGEGESLQAVGRSVDALDLNGNRYETRFEGAGFLVSQTESFVGGTSRKSRDGRTGEIPGGFHSGGIGAAEVGCNSGYTEILRAAASRDLPEDEEVARRSSHESGAEIVNNSNSSGDSPARLSALAEVKNASSGRKGSSQVGNVSFQAGNSPGLEERGQEDPGYLNHAGYDERELPGGRGSLDEPPTPEVVRRKGLNCFPKFQKRVGRGKPERVSAKPSCKPPSNQEDGSASQSEPVVFLSARESSMDRLSQSLEALTEGLTDGLTEGDDVGEEGFATRASPESSSTMGLEIGKRDVGPFPPNFSYFNPLADYPFASPSTRHVSAHMAIQLPHTGYPPHPPSRRTSYEPPPTNPPATYPPSGNSSPGNTSPGDRYFTMRSSPRRTDVTGGLVSKEGGPGPGNLPPHAGESPAENLQGPYLETTSSSDVASSFTAGGGDGSSRKRGGRKGSPLHPAYPPGELALDTLQVMEIPNQRGPPRLALQLGGAPLHVLERHMRLRFSVGDSYAYDPNGRPTFSVVGEPSDQLVGFLEECDIMLMQQLAPHAAGAAWRQTVVRKQGEVPSIRIRIGAIGYQQTATYTTKFLRQRRSGKGIERLPLGVVDPLIFRSFFPHGCSVDVTFSIETYCVEGHAGCRLVASQLTLV